MQTDPNWSNFLYNPQTDKLQLIDFGASREYSKEFMDDWYMLLSAAVREDKEACVEYSRRLGYLTGEESQVRNDQSGLRGYFWLIWFGRKWSTRMSSL